MKKTDMKYEKYIQILKKELIPAMGCTEPIALAYAAAIAKETLGEAPDRIKVGVSGSILKNAKSVVVPNTGGMKGIQAAIAAGIVVGESDKKLEVIAGASKEQIPQIIKYKDTTEIEVEYLDQGLTFDIYLTAWCREDKAEVRIANAHTNVVLIRKNDEILYQTMVEGVNDTTPEEYNLLNMEDIWDFINTVDLAEVKDTLDRQISFNMAIAEEGLRGNYGANIGSVLLSMEENTVRIRAKAYAAAGSDARMSGCELPVVINSGSGNQGMTVSLPVIIYAKELGVSDEKLYRALLLSNLTAIHEKTPIGRLSAYCGAVSAGVGAGAGIAYLHGGDYTMIIHTIVNALAIVSGMVCDGAKASCAAKIASAVEAGILGYHMYANGQQFYSGDGLVTKGIEATIRNFGRLGKEGMRETNQEIIRMMLGE